MGTMKHAIQLVGTDNTYRKQIRFSEYLSITFPRPSCETMQVIRVCFIPIHDAHNPFDTTKDNVRACIEAKNPFPDDPCCISDNISFPCAWERTNVDNKESRERTHEPIRTLWSQLSADVPSVQ